MAGTVASLLGLALVDSINPSALAVTVLLLSRGGSYAPRVLVYVLGVFLSYLAVGVVLVLGFGVVRGALEGPVAYGVQGVGGALLLGYALLAPERPRGRRRGRGPVAPGLAAVFLLGVTVTVAEAPTAFPYLGAAAILTGEGGPVELWLPLLVGYDAVFVLPPLALLGAYAAFGGRAAGLMERLRERFGEGSRETMLWVLGFVGVFLLADSAAFFGFLGEAGTRGGTSNL